VNELMRLVEQAQAGDLEAFGRLVAATQRMTYAVTRSVLRDPAAAEDATQETYLRAFRRLSDLEHPAGFIPWVRRIAISVALNLRRATRVTFLQLDPARCRCSRRSLSGKWKLESAKCKVESALRTYF
jgi:DNA-directed RNA polymerase specialized sigma24 family protein